MKAAKITSILCLCFVSTVVGQQVNNDADPMQNPRLVRMAETTAIPTHNRGISSRRSEAVADLQSAQQWGYEPAPAQVGGMLNPDPLSFNATQPRSRLLVNPDVFWTRKSRPVIDQSGDALFGDSNCACDEWQGVCGCCGMKANPGHLGIRSLNSGTPCECVDNCCPAPRCQRCHHQ